VVRLAVEGERTSGYLWVLLCFEEEEEEKKKDESFGRRQLQPMSTTTGCLTRNLLRVDDMGLKD